MANSSRLCLICAQVFGSDAERRAHQAAEHAGSRVEWREKVPYVVTGDTATRIGPSALKRMRATARKVTGGRAATRGRAVVRHPGAAAPVAPVAPVMVETPLPDDPDAPPYFTQAQPFHLTALGATIPPAGDAAGAGDGPTATPPAVSRESIRLALDQPTLAGILRNLSIVVSDWDGAGDRGHLSAIEAGQLAMLLHEPAIAAIQRYFGGNVDKFKLALAAGILLLGKGRIHIAAIAAKRREAEAHAEGGAIDTAYAATQPDMPTDAPAPDGAADPLAELAARQRAWNTAPRVDAA